MSLFDPMRPGRSLLRGTRYLVAGPLLAAGLGLTVSGAIAQEQPATGAAAAPAATAAAKPAPIDPKAVVATVGGQPIVEADLQFAAEDLSQELANVPPAERKAFLTTVLIDMKMMAEAARKEGLQDTDAYKMRLNYLQDRALRRAYFTDKIAGKVTKEAIKAAYDNLVAKYKPQPEVQVRHILVATEDAANKIRKEIEGGKPFQVAAMENSLDKGTATKGGELGFIVHGQTVKPFEDAAFSLPVGQLSKPIKTQFGWHLIEVEKKGTTTPPPFDKVEAQLQQKVMVETFDKQIKALKADTTVSFTDPNMAAAVAAEEKKGVE